MNDDLLTLRDVAFLRRVQGSEPKPFYCKGPDLGRARRMETIGFCEWNRLNPDRLVTLTERAKTFLIKIDRIETHDERKGT